MARLIISCRVVNDRCRRMSTFFLKSAQFFPAALGARERTFKKNPMMMAIRTPTASNQTSFFK